MSQRRHRVVGMAAAIDQMQRVAAILAEYGPMHEDGIVRRLRHAGVTDTRGHMYWLDDDLACRTVADRVARWTDEDPENDPPFAGSGAEACAICHYK